MSSLPHLFDPPSPIPLFQGSFDGEGSPLILFRLCKHDRNSDHKAAMQLLFYTLDQVAEL